MLTIEPNVKQKECIDNINGKYLVLAGPGTGKTFTIIQRIKAMLNSGIEGNKILCLTFTDAAANEMKVRLEKELDKLNVDVNIYTYHSFCCNIIDENIEEFEFPHNYRIMTDAVSRAFLKECIDEINPKYFRTEKNDPYYYIDTIKRRIEEIKKHRLTKDTYFQNIKLNPDWQPELDSLIKELEIKLKKGETRVKTLQGNIETQQKKINQAEELWDFYELYQSKMERNNYIDYNDMINSVLLKFESNPSFLETVANKYEYILVDEYQDTNKSQNAIVFNLAKSLKSENIFVVGDDDQIIYTFQGAKLDTIERFLEEFKDTKVICLENNMRSTQQILDTARAIAKQDYRRLENNPKFKQYNISKDLVAKNEKLLNIETPVRCYKYADKMQEYTEIVEEIENLINSENCPVDTNNNKKLSEIAILTRSNAELEEFAEMFKARNIPFELKEGKNIFKISAVNILYYYMLMLVNPEMNSFRVFQVLLAKPFGINPKDYMKLYESLSKYKTFIDAIRNIPKTDLLEPEKFDNFIKTYDYLNEFKTKENIKSTVIEIGTKTGIFNYYINTDLNKTENIAGLKRLVDEAESFSDIYKSSFLESFVEYLQLLLKDELEVLTDKAPVSLNAVQLCTYYASKGREFEYVYMPTLIHDKWEGFRASLKPEIPLSPDEYKVKEELDELKISDRIKVMYVGMTRAKHTLRLSYVQTINGKPKKPSDFIANIQDMFEKEPEPFVYNEETYWYQASKALVKRDYDYKKEFCNLVDSRIENKSFSPTSINTYLGCPRQYLYKYILDFNGKDGNPDNLSFGSAVHYAAEIAVKNAIEKGEYLAKDSFIKCFKEKLDELPVSSYEQRFNLIGRGEKALSEFHHFLCNTPISNLKEVEFPITFDLDGIKFYGIIDRIDLNDDGTYNIYDYKTGSAKNGKVICPDGEKEDYYNQMGLYKYFFEKSTGKKVKQTTFIFPEDYTKNYTLEYSEDDCNKIVEKFKTTIDSIKKYEFEPTYNADSCKYCPYKDFCNMEII